MGNACKCVCLVKSVSFGHTFNFQIILILLFPKYCCNHVTFENCVVVNFICQEGHRL